MPWRSVAQARWGHSPAGEKALGGPNAVSEWDAATPKGSLPMRRRTVNLGKKGSFEEKPGALHAMLHVPQGEKIPESRIESAEHSSNPKLRRRAISAEGFKHMHHGG